MAAFRGGTLAARARRRIAALLRLGADVVEPDAGPASPADAGDANADDARADDVGAHEERDLAAWRQRFPDAPDEWLRLVASHAPDAYRDGVIGSTASGTRPIGAPRRRTSARPKAGATARDTANPAPAAPRGDAGDGTSQPNGSGDDGSQATGTTSSRPVGRPELRYREAAPHRPADPRRTRPAAPTHARDDLRGTDPQTKAGGRAEDDRADDPRRAARPAGRPPVRFRDTRRDDEREHERDKRRDGGAGAPQRPAAGRGLRALRTSGTMRPRLRFGSHSHGAAAAAAAMHRDGRGDDNHSSAPTPAAQAARGDGFQDNGTRHRAAAGSRRGDAGAAASVEAQRFAEFAGFHTAIRNREPRFGEDAAATATSRAVYSRMREHTRAFDASASTATERSDHTAASFFPPWPSARGASRTDAVDRWPELPEEPESDGAASAAGIAQRMTERLTRLIADQEGRGWSGSLS